MGREQPKTIPSNNNAVRITYYIESQANTIRSNQASKPQQSSGKPQTRRKCGYDRRAELLYYTNQLKNADSNSSSSSSDRKKKWKWSTTPARLRVLFLRICWRMRGGRWKYEQMPSEDGNDINSRKKKRSSRKSTSRFCKKFKCMLRGLSMGGKKA